MKKALIIGVTGQDGSYLAELLLSKGYEVHGLKRCASILNTQRIDHLYTEPLEPSTKFFLYHGDITDSENIRKLIFKIKPVEIYNLAAQSHVGISFAIPEYTANVVALGTLRILEAIRDFESFTGEKIKFYQASSSEMFGNSPPPQNEETKFYPRSPYGAAKTFAFHITKNYREAYNIFACNGILFNHESPRRGEIFVTRKITRGVARIKAGLDKKIYLGNLESKRDWGYAPEYVEAMYLMMQQATPSDYVVGTGEAHSVKEFVEDAFKYAGISPWQEYIEISPRYMRPIEVENLIADYSKIKKELEWEPKTKFKDLVKIMVNSDIEKCLKL